MIYYNYYDIGVCLCAVVWVSVCVRARVHVFVVCVFELLTSKYRYVLDLFLSA